MTDNQSTSSLILRVFLGLLLLEKIIQHAVVTLAFYFNWADIGRTVVVNPKVLMWLGGLVAILFIVALWGFLKWKTWALNLIVALALFDIIGEFIAQGRIGITLNVSFIIAVTLLITTLVYRQKVVAK